MKCPCTNYNVKNYHQFFGDETRSFFLTKNVKFDGTIAHRQDGAASLEISAVFRLLVA